MLIADALRERVLVMFVYDQLNWDVNKKAMMGYHTYGNGVPSEGTYNYPLSLTSEVYSLTSQSNMGKLCTND